MAFGDRTHPEDLPAVLSLYKDVIAGTQTFASLEVRVRHKLGEWRRIRFNFSPLSDEKGNIEGVVLSGRDVTELKRLEEQLIQSEKLAAMGQMLAGVAHELNNPLTAILGVTELLREREGADDSTRRQLELTHRQARRAARIVQNLLEFSRPASPLKRPSTLITFSSARSSCKNTLCAATISRWISIQKPIFRRHRGRQPAHSGHSEPGHQRRTGHPRSPRHRPHSDSCRPQR